MRASTALSSTCRSLLPGLLLLVGCQGSGEYVPPGIPPTQPRARDTPPPVYPPELACANVGGQVVLTLVITRDGRTSEIQVQRSSGNAQLDQSATQAVRGWTFTPATVGGQPAARRIQVPVTFRPPPIRPDSCFALDAQRRQGS